MKLESLLANYINQPRFRILMQFRNIKGTTDFYPEEQYVQDKIFEKMSVAAEKFGYSHVEPPAIEHLDLLTAKSGEEIKNQIFVMEKKGKEEIGLRFEFTAGLARMIVARQKALIKPVKWYSLNRVWRYERPQAGREREFFQFNVETYGSERPEADAEVINLAIETLLSLGLSKDDFVVRINNRKLLQGLLAGIVPEKDMNQVIHAIDKREKLSRDEFRAELDFLDDSSFDMIVGLLSKDLDDISKDDLSSAASEGFKALKSIIDILSYDNVVFDLSVVRGLDYYTGTVFEIFDTKRKFRALCGGGRYDNIIETFGGSPMPAVGFGVGFSTLYLLLKHKKLLPEYRQDIDYFIVAMDDSVRADAMRITNKLRKSSSAVMDLMGRSRQKQLKYAYQIGAKSIIFVGTEEVKKGNIKIKDLKTGKEKDIRISDI